MDVSSIFNSFFRVRVDKLIGMVKKFGVDFKKALVFDRSIIDFSKDKFIEKFCFAFLFVLFLCY